MFHPRNATEDKSDRTEFQPTRTISDCLAELRHELGAKSLSLHPDPLGGFCGYALYRKSPLQIAGLNIPNDFYFWRRCSPSDSPDRAYFMSELRKTCDKRINEALSNEDKATAGQWREILLSFFDKSGMHNNVVRLASATEACLPDTITLSGQPGNYQVVPQVSWFPQNVQDFDARDLLSILPKAEAEQLMLILGRLMCGAKNTMTAEGFLSHTARAYAIIVGKDAGMGKSTLIGHIKKMIVALGYTTAEINTDFNRFGWRRIAQSSLATVDDLTEETQKKMIQNGYVKSVVSNDRLSVEDKGIDACDVVSKTVVIGCSNDSHYAHFIGMDAGALSRLNLLGTYNRTELAKDKGIDPTDSAAIDHYLLPKYWEDLAKQFGTTPDVLCCYLLARSAEKFLSATGYEIQDGRLARVRESTLYEQTKANRSRFRIMPSLQHMQEVVRVTAALCALAIHEADDDAQARRLTIALDRTDFCAPLLLGFFELCIADQTFDAPLAELNRPMVASSTIIALKDRIRDIEGAIGGKTSEAAFELAVKELKSEHGFGYPSRSSHYQEYWKECTRNRDTHLAIWRKTPPKVTRDLRLAIDRVSTYLLRLA